MFIPEDSSGLPKESKELKKPKKKKRRTRKSKMSSRFLKGRKPVVIDVAKVTADHKRMVERSIKKFVYHLGNFYPGMGKAHMNCAPSSTRVPAKMGWNWNLNETSGRLRPRSGWRPGALLVSFLNMSSKKIRFKQKSTTKQKKVEEEEPEPEEFEVPPTLRVLRKDGIYHITMYPIEKEEESRVDVLPQPIQFTIEKDMDDASSTPSDMEIEYSVPIAVSRYYKKPDLVHVDTQVAEAEILNAFKPPKREDKNKKLKQEKNIQNNKNINFRGIRVTKLK